MRYVIAKLLRISSNQHAGLIRFLFTEENSFQATFFMELLEKKIYFAMLHELTEFHYHCVYSSGYSKKCVSFFMLRHLRRRDI